MLKTLNKPRVKLTQVCFRNKLRVTLIALIGTFLVSGCTGGAGPQAPFIGTGANTNVAAPTATPNQAKQEYRLGSGDRIRLNVYGEEDLSGEFDVSGNGKLSLPLVGDIQAGGLTVPEFQASLTSKLKTYLKNPVVNAQVLNYRPFYIRGEVKTGGEYPFSNGLVVADAVAKAGGYTYRAVTNHVFIRRANEKVERKYSLDGQVRVLPGDNIRVPERIF